MSSDDEEAPEAVRGRPTLYTKELGDLICELLGDGVSLTRICNENPDLPSDRTIRRWALDPEHPFSPQYARARIVGWHKMADDILDISDDGSNDHRTKVNADGSTVEVVDHDHISRSRLRTENRKWLLSKVLPKIYGDKIAVGGDADAPPVQLTIKRIIVRPGGKE